MGEEDGDDDDEEEEADDEEEEEADDEEEEEAAAGRIRTHCGEPGGQQSGWYGDGYGWIAWAYRAAGR